MMFDKSVSVAKSAEAKSEDFLVEFVKDFSHAAFINPYNSAAQLSKSLAEIVLHNDLGIHTTEFLKPTETATGARGAGKKVGEVAGTVFDFMVASRILKEIPAFKSAKLPGGIVESERSLTTKQMFLTTATGFTQGALLTPLNENEAQSHRLINGTSVAASFLAMESVPFAPGLRNLEKSFKNDVIKSAVAGGAGGAVRIQTESFLTNSRPAGFQETFNATIGGAGGGALFGAVFRGLRPAGAKPEAEINNSELKDGPLILNAAPETDAGLVKSIDTGRIQHPDGTDTKVVVRSLDTSDDIWSLQRVLHAKIVQNLHINEGFNGKPPEIAVRTEEFAGKVQDVSVQTHGGSSFGGQVRLWAAQAKGIDTSSIEASELGKIISSKAIADYIAVHPALYDATGEGFARKLADGGLDLNLSNWTIPETVSDGANPDGPVSLYDIDPKRGFGLNTTPTYGPEIKFGDAPEVLKLYEGKKLSDISPKLQSQFDTLVAKYEAPGGLQSMERSGLSLDEAGARLARLKHLSANGFPAFMGMGFPPEAPVYYMTPEYDAEAKILDPQILAKAKSLTVDYVRAITNK